MTTVYPTTATGVHGNSGGKSAGKHLFPSGKGRKCLETSGNRYSGFLWDCEIGNSSKIPYTSKKPLILRFFRFHIFCKYAIIGLRPHSVPQLRNFCKNPSIKLNISGCGAVGSARHLGCRCRRFEPCHSDQILTEF